MARGGGHVIGLKIVTVVPRLIKAEDHARALVHLATKRFRSPWPVLWMHAKLFPSSSFLVPESCTFVPVLSKKNLPECVSLRICSFSGFAFLFLFL